TPTCLTICQPTSPVSRKWHRDWSITIRPTSTSLAMCRPKIACRRSTLGIWSKSWPASWRWMTARSPSRAFENRLVGCCRDFALLTCAILRYQGRPARLRYGFAAYFSAGYWGDHVVVETWNGDRWQRFDPQIPASDHWGFDVLDMPQASFATGGRAWQMCRNEGADPLRFGLGPDVLDVRGWWFVRGRLQLDIA